MIESRFYFILIDHHCSFKLKSKKYKMSQKDNIFKGYLYNDEYQVYIEMDFYHNTIKVPGQEIFGDLPGYFGAKY